MKRSLAWLFLTALVHMASAADDPASCTAALPPAPAAELNCTADTAACAIWKQFRAGRPYPYQAIVVAAAPQAGRTILIFSEPPPLGSSNDMSRLLQAVLGVRADQIHRLRYPLGLDGWLEDWIVTVPSGTEATVAIPDAQGGQTQIAAPLADKLRFLDGALFGAPGLLYVDTLLPVGDNKQFSNLQISTGELSTLASAKDAVWRPLMDERSAPRRFDQLLPHPAPAVFTDAQMLLLALVIPPKTTLAKMRREFRQFALGSDFIVGAIQPKKGGLVLLGRHRLIPLGALPPLRFETLQTLASSNQSLGQSYERQRVFAGKIQMGSHAGWDWAPIFLSPQLQDTEMGSLLNIADQQLKSWSQCGRVRYAHFDYAAPAKFPFASVTASGWFKEKTDSDSLIFNWNTSGFATAFDAGDARILAASGTTALPVSYIIPLNSDKPTKRGQASTEGSQLGSNYFADLGDPVLVRVVQNVFLFQLLNDTKPFQAAARTASTGAATSRSELVSDLLIKRTEAWLKDLQANPATRDSLAANLVKMLKNKNGLSPGKLAELLAVPERSRQELMRQQRAFELKRTAALQLERDRLATIEELKEVFDKARSEFIVRCRKIGGSVDDDGRTKLSCGKLSAAMKQQLDMQTPTEKKVDVLATQLQQLKSEEEKLIAELKKDMDAMRILHEQELAADAVADLLRQLASYGSDLDNILTEVLSTSKVTESHTTIQTPTVVLSQDAGNAGAVGGHNIDALPLLVKAAGREVQPSLHFTGERPFIALGKADVANSTRVSRAVLTASEAKPEVARDLPTALAAPAGPRASFLEKLGATKAISELDPQIAARAKACACDVYVEGGAGETLALVRLKPPPPAPPRTFYGSTAVSEHLAAIPGDFTTLFAKVQEKRALAISESAARQARQRKGAPQPSLLEQHIVNAKTLFRRGADKISETMSLRTKSGHNLLVKQAENPHGRLADMLAEKAEWSSLTVHEPGASGNFARQPVVLVEVKFGGPNTPMRGIEVHSYAGGELQNPSAASMRQALARMKAAETVQAGLTKLTDQIYKDNKDVTSVEFFLHAVGKETARRLEWDRNGDLVLAESGR